MACKDRMHPVRSGLRPLSVRSFWRWSPGPSHLGRCAACFIILTAIRSPSTDNLADPRGWSGGDHALRAHAQGRDQRAQRACVPRRIGANGPQGLASPRTPGGAPTALTGAERLARNARCVTLWAGQRVGEVCVLCSPLSPSVCASRPLGPLHRRLRTLGTSHATRSSAAGLANARRLPRTRNLDPRAPAPFRSATTPSPARRGVATTHPPRRAPCPPSPAPARPAA